VDEFDLLDATLDYDDSDNLLKRKELELELANEVIMLQCKRAFKLSFMPDDPFNNGEV
jgi:hypothetical protein